MTTPIKRAQTRTAATVAVTLALLMVTALPSAAGWDNGPDDPPGPVVRYEDVVAVAFVDEADGLVALGGPPPEQGCFGEGFDDIGDVQEIDLGDVVMLVQRDGDQPMQVYEGEGIGDVCERIVAGETVEPIATGTVRAMTTDNDADVSLTRANSFGSTAIGTLTTPEGQTCSFRGTFRAIIDPNDEFRGPEEDISLRC
jgi:hypothetical protein